MLYQVTSAKLGKDEDGDPAIFIKSESDYEFADFLLYCENFVKLEGYNEDYPLDLLDLFKNPKNYLVNDDEDEIYLFKPSGS